MTTSFTMIVRITNVLIIAFFASSSANNINRDYFPCSNSDVYINSNCDYDINEVDDTVDITAYVFPTWLIVVIGISISFVVIKIVICACCMIPSCPLHHTKRYRGRVVQNPATASAGATVYPNQLPAYPTNQGVIYPQGPPPTQYTVQYHNSTPVAYQQPPNVYQHHPNVYQQPPNIYDQTQNEQLSQTPVRN